MLKSIEFLRGKSRGRVIGGTKLASPAPVILGLVPRILWKRVSNLVNKFALLLHKCWSSMLSAFCMLFKYPSPDAKASPSPARGEGLYRPWCNKILGTDCASRPRMTGGRGANSFGRSMIEMLGVLAIIAVLSVGGIAGYSKAMEKYKLNKTVEEYSYVIHGLLEHLPELQKLNSGGGQYMLTDFLLAANMVPATWSRRGTDLSDSYGGAIAIFIRSNHLSLEIYHHYPYASGGALSSVEFCKTMIKDIAQPLASAMYGIGLYQFDYADGAVYGDAYCDEEKICLRDLTVSEINKICHSYKEGVSYSSVILYF